MKSARAAASGMWPLVALSVLPAPHPHGVGPHPAADGVLALFSLRVPPNERDAWAARVDEGAPHASTAVPPLRLAHEDTAWIRRAASLPGSPGLGAPMWRRGSYDSPALLLLLHAQGGNAGTEAGGEPFLRARGQPLTSATSALDRSDGAPRPAGAAFRVQAVGGRHLLAAEAASPHGAAPHGGATDSLLRLLPRFSRLAACCADATTGVVYAIGDLASDAEGRPSCHVATCDRALRVLAVSPIKGPSPATRAGAGRSGAGKEEEQKEEDSGRITSACLVGASLAVGTAGGRVGTWDFSRGAVTAGVEPARWIPAAAGAMHPSLLAARARGLHWAVQRLVPACARVPVRRASSAAGERRTGRTPAREPTSLAPEWRIAVTRRGGGVDVCDASLQRVLRRISLVGSPAAFVAAPRAAAVPASRTRLILSPRPALPMLQVSAHVAPGPPAVPGPRACSSGRADVRRAAPVAPAHTAGPLHCARGQCGAGWGHRGGGGAAGRELPRAPPRPSAAAAARTACHSGHTPRRRGGVHVDRRRAASSPASGRIPACSALPQLGLGGRAGAPSSAPSSLSPAAPSSHRLSLCAGGPRGAVSRAAGRDVAQRRLPPRPWQPRCSRGTPHTGHGGCCHGCRLACGGDRPRGA